MSANPKLEAFLRDIMSVQVLSMGGARAGILGSADPAGDTVNDLKKQALAFAAEYHRPEPDREKLSQLSKEIYGCTQTLLLTHTLSEQRGRSLDDQLQSLMEAA